MTVIKTALISVSDKGGLVDFARGLAGYGADEVRRIAGLKTSEIEGALGYKYLDEVVHRDDMVLLDQH